MEQVAETSENTSTVFRKVNKNLTAIAGVITTLGVLYGAVNYCYTNYYLPDLNDTWKMTFHIESSSLKRYIGKSSGYKVLLHNTDGKISGKGERWWIDNEEIPYAQHDRIELEGKVEGKRLHITYTLYGLKRTTIGTVDVAVEGRDNMIGVFTGTAADTKGRAVVERL